MAPNDPYGLNALLGFQFDATGAPTQGMQLPPQLQYQPTEAPPIPFSPEGWQLSQTMQGTGAKAPEGAPATDKKKDGAGAMLTADQARTIAALTGAGTAAHYPGTPGLAAGRGLTGAMQQHQMPASAPRRSLGQLIYGR
jgi:hypothetical protein